MPRVALFLCTSGDQADRARRNAVDEKVATGPEADKFWLDRAGRRPSSKSSSATTSMTCQTSWFCDRYAS